MALTGRGAVVFQPEIGFCPDRSYDLGGAVEWEVGDFALTGVGMNVGENDDLRTHNFYGLTLDYAINTKLGEGHYRVTVDWTSEDFVSPEGDKIKSKRCAILSFDQPLGEILGAWLVLFQIEFETQVSHETRESLFFD